MIDVNGKERIFVTSPSDHISDNWQMTTMCNQDALQQNITRFTKDGEHIARFLTETMRGETPGVKVCHRMEAAKHLIRYGFPDDQTAQQSPLSPGERVRDLPLRRQGVRGTENTPFPPTGEGWDGGEDSPPSMSAPVTHLDIINYQIAHLIRHETAEGHTLVEFLIHIMTGKDRPFTPKKFRIKPADRMAAARELLRRGFGDLGSRRRQSDTTDEANAYDTLHTDLAKRMREYSERGTDTVRFLLEVMSDPDPDLEFTIHHRMSAAQELLRRGWDTNYDAVKPKHLQAYWRDKESTSLSVGQKKTQAGLSTSIDDYDQYDDTDYEAIAKEVREEEDRDVNSKPLRFQETVPSSRHSSESRDPEDHQATSPATKLPLPEGLGRREGTNNSLPPRRGKARMGVTEPASNGMLQSESGSTPTSKLPLPQGEGWGEGNNESPSSSKSTLAEAKYRRIDVKPEKNIYDYGPNDPDPTIDYYFEPLTPEEQAKFDKEERREHGLTEEEIADYSSMPVPHGMSDPLVQLAEAAEAHNTPILPNPLAPKRKNPTIRSP